MFQQFYNIHASFLVPAYNMPQNTQSAFITTQHGQHPKAESPLDQHPHDVALQRHLEGAHAGL